MVQMLRIPGLGPKKVKALYEQLHVRDIGELKAACERGEVARLKGFGDKTQAKILEGIEFLQRQGQRVRLDQALPLAEELMEQLRRGGQVQQIAVCGSVRRRCETVHDLDILVCSEAPQQVMNRFAEAVERSQIDVVPRVLITDGRGEGGGTSSVFEALLTLLLAEHMGEPVTADRSGEERAPEVEAIREQIRRSLAAKDRPASGTPETKG